MDLFTTIETAEPYRKPLSSQPTFASAAGAGTCGQRFLRVPRNKVLLPLQGLLISLHGAPSVSLSRCSELWDVLDKRSVLECDHCPSIITLTALSTFPQITSARQSSSLHPPSVLLLLVSSIHFMRIYQQFTVLLSNILMIIVSDQINYIDKASRTVSTIVLCSLP